MIEQSFDIITSELGILRSYKKQLDSDISREFSYNGFTFKRSSSACFHVRFGGLVYIKITYGNITDGKDMSDKFPFCIAFDDICESCNSYQTKELKVMTADEAVAIIRQELLKHENSNKKQKTDYDINHFCADIHKSMISIKLHSRFVEQFHLLRNLMHM